MMHTGALRASRLRKLKFWFWVYQQNFKKSHPSAKSVRRVGTSLGLARLYSTKGSLEAEQKFAS